jgi:hypothetical protein
VAQLQRRAARRVRAALFAATDGEAAPDAGTRMLARAVHLLTAPDVVAGLAEVSLRCRGAHITLEHEHASTSLLRLLLCELDAASEAGAAAPAEDMS